VPGSARIRYLDAEFVQVTPGVRPAYVSKTLLHRSYRGYDHVALMLNEAAWLRRLKRFLWAPMLVMERDLTLVMSYVGERITAATLPADWEQQVEDILEDMSRVPCCHNDVKRTELLVLDGRIRLIDFQHATETRAEHFALKRSGACGCRNAIDDRTAMIGILGRIARSEGG